MKRLLAFMLAIMMTFTLLITVALAEEENSEQSATFAQEGAEGNDSDTTATAEPTAEPTPEPTAEPVATATPVVTPTPEAVAPTASPETTPTPAATPETAATPTATPVSDPKGEIRVTMGADLTARQRAAIYADFGIAEGTVTELTVTNAEERQYLEGLVPDKKIGSVALSCIYIEMLEAGAGLNVNLHNINYCTADMYRNALTTAGITDANVIVSAPYPVSGTGALTGAYKAYEDITGTALSQLAKSVGAEELVVTGELAEYIGSDDATAIINELKGMLEQTQGMTDSQVKEETANIAKAYNVTVTDGQIDQVLSLVRKLEGLDSEQLQDQLASLARTAQTVGQASETVSKVFESVTGFFASIGNFFAKLFGGGNR